MKIFDISGGKKPVGVFKHLLSNIKYKVKPKIEKNSTTYLFKDHSNPKQKPSGSVAKGRDMGNRLSTGGRTGNMKIDKFQGYKIPPMY